jgi:hypothetical protein
MEIGYGQQLEPVLLVCFQCRHLRGQSAHVVES